MIRQRYSIPKVETFSFKSQALRETAYGAPCMMRVPGVCTGDDETVVLAHSDKLRHGNGWGTKGHDFHTAFCCAACHFWYGHGKDGNAVERDQAFEDAHDRTWRWLLETGRVKIGRAR